MNTTTPEQLLAHTLKQIEENGPMAGLRTMLLIDLINLAKLAIQGAPQDRLTDYISAITTYYVNLTFLVNTKMAIDELTKHPKEKAGHIALLLLKLTLEAGEKSEPISHQRLTLLRDALIDDFYHTPHTPNTPQTGDPA